MLDGSNNTKFDYLLGFHSSPTLAGIKCASLFSIKKNCIDNIESEVSVWSGYFNEKGINIKILCECKNNILIFVYNQKMLRDILQREDISNFLDDLNYPVNNSLEDNILFLSKRIKTSCDFPHEIGIFLGYPYKDVIGFQKNKGKNYIISGYWKVYSDEEYAQKIFDRFTRCRNNVCNRIKNGMQLNQIFKVA